MNRRRLLGAGLAALLGPAAARAQMPAYAWDDGSVPFVVTPMEVVARMLQLADVGPGDTVIDLGSGDGRIVIEAARRGARALGIELDKSLVAAAEDNARAAGLAERARFEAMDLFAADLSAATVITLYLLPELNARLRPRLLALTPGTRIVSHDAGLGDWPFDERLELRVPDKPVGVGFSRVELWVVPARVAGIWNLELPEHGGRWTLRIAQRYQLLEVEVAATGGRDFVVPGVRLRGAQLALVTNGIVGRRAWRNVFSGTVEGGRITGELLASDGNESRSFAFTAVR
ncbi:MAG: methyltransferase domain-containing protein [Betaproteobacteria bacterium]|nr:methyltransferase domain-containing protein [Betaproteobacteria bacterium]